MIGERIRQARLAASMTQEEVVAGLAQSGMSISKAALSKYERGKSIPRACLILALSKLFVVSIEFLLQEASISFSWLDYGQDIDPVQNRECVLARAIGQVEKYLWIHEVLSPREVTSSFPTRHVTTLEDVEKAAIWIRDEWQIGTQTIHSLVRLLEGRGFILVGLTKEESDFESLSGWVTYRESKFPVIVFDAAQQPDCIRMSLGKALGHLVLRLPPEQKEQMICRFAEAFLAPRAAVIAEVGVRRSFICFVEIMLLRQKYGLGKKDCVKRIRDLGIISESLSGLLASCLSRDLSAPYLNVNEVCNRLRMMTSTALSEGYISAVKAEEICPGSFQDQVDACQRTLREELAEWEKSGGTPPARLWFYLPKEVRNQLLLQVGN